MPEQADELTPPSTPQWVLPEPLSTHDVRVDDDTVIVLRRHGNPDGARLILTHANGLAADLYYPFWSLLADQFDLIVHDLRNHGWNRVGAQVDHNIPTMIRDHDIILESIDQIYGSKPTIGIHHSLTTIVSLLSSSERYAALILFDPPIAKHGQSQVDIQEAARKSAAMTRRRGHRFSSPEEFVEILQVVPIFRRTVPGAHELMARTTLRWSESEQVYMLRCPREYEAQLMEYGRSFFTLVDLDSKACPIKIIGADPTLPQAFLPALDQRWALTMDYDLIPDTTHFLQWEKPAECVAVTREFIERHGFA